MNIFTLVSLKIIPFKVPERLRPAGFAVDVFSLAVAKISKKEKKRRKKQEMAFVRSVASERIYIIFPQLL